MGSGGGLGEGGSGGWGEGGGLVLFVFDPNDAKSLEVFFFVFKVYFVLFYFILFYFFECFFFLFFFFEYFFSF